MRSRPTRSRSRAANPVAAAREFFQNQVLPCARCHKVGGEGGEAGPDLSLIGEQKSKEYLLESIIKPSAHIAAGFDIVTLQLKNGDTETGSVASETPTEIVLKRADNTTTTIDPKQVKERVTAPSSMPEIYGAGDDARAAARHGRASCSVLTQPRTAATAKCRLARAIAR